MWDALRELSEELRGEEKHQGQWNTRRIQEDIVFEHRIAIY